MKRYYGEGKGDQLPGTHALVSTRLASVATLCALQYWLLTTAMEAHHGGNIAVTAIAFGVSLVCFILCAAILVSGEVSAKKLNIEMEKEGHEPENN